MRKLEMGRGTIPRGDPQGPNTQYWVFCQSTNRFCEKCTIFFSIFEIRGWRARCQRQSRIINFDWNWLWLNPRWLIASTSKLTRLPPIPTQYGVCLLQPCNYNFWSFTFFKKAPFFSCPGQLNKWHCRSVGRSEPTNNQSLGSIKEWP